MHTYRFSHHVSYLSCFTMKFVGTRGACQLPAWAPNARDRDWPCIKTFYHSGCFIDDAVRYEAMSIRHWLIQPYEIVLQTPIHEITYLLKPEQCELSPLRSCNSPCIFVGSASDPKLYAAISTFAQSLLGYPDPFNAVSLPEFIPPSSSLQSASPQCQRALSARGQFAKTRSPCK